MKQTRAPHAQPSTPADDQSQPLLETEAHRYDFFQVVRLIERRFPKATRLGTRGPASRERVRLRPSTDMTFPTSEVQSVEWLETGKYSDPRVEIVTNFLGLVGQSTPLPLTYAQEVMWDEEDQPHMRAFLDMFHHRLLSLLYRSWQTYRHQYAFEEGGRDRLTRALLDLVGVSPEQDEEELGLPPERIVRYLGMFLMPDRPTTALGRFLSEELGVDIRVIPLTQRWIPMPSDQVFTMDPNQRKKGFLGVDIVIGTRMVDRTGHITLEIGPVGYEKLSQYRPGEQEHRRLLALTRLFVRQPLDLELRVLVPTDQVPVLRLGGPNPPKLGQTTQLGAPESGFMTMTFNASIAESALAGRIRRRSRRA